MSLMEITVYALIGLGAFVCICALIWTKLIKPNKFGYSNKNILVKKEFNQLIKKLDSQSKTIYYENLILDINQSQSINIDHMIVTVQNVYLISNPLENKVLDVNKDLKNNIKMIYFKKQLDLPIDVLKLISNSKIIKELTNYKKIKIIIPVSNQEFEDKNIDDIAFVNKNNLYQYVIDFDDKPSQFNSIEFLKIIDSTKRKQKQKRKLFGII